MNIKDIRREIKRDKENYLGGKKLIYMIIRHQNYIYYNALKYNRLYRFYKMHHSGIIKKIIYLFIIYKKNIYCNKYGLELNGAKIGKNFTIFHRNIIINEKSTIGDNCHLHGNNCIGNNGINNKCPQIGNNVDIGYGSAIIGDITIEDNIIIGANSIVTKNLLEKNAIYAGCPAKLVRRKKGIDI